MVWCSYSSEFIWLHPIEARLWTYRRLKVLEYVFVFLLICAFTIILVKYASQAILANTWKRGHSSRHMKFDSIPLNNDNKQKALPSAGITNIGHEFEEALRNATRFYKTFVTPINSVGNTDHDYYCKLPLHQIVIWTWVQVDTYVLFTEVSHLCVYWDEIISLHHFGYENRQFRITVCISLIFVKLFTIFNKILHYFYTNLNYKSWIIPVFSSKIENSESYYWNFFSIN